MLCEMDAITLTRQLVDIESITGNEAAVGNYLYGELCRLGYHTLKMPVEANRFNLYATAESEDLAASAGKSGSPRFTPIGYPSDQATDRVSFCTSVTWL